jgi:signal transduction histidine kinase
MTINPDEELCILLVEDNPGDATLFEHHLTTDRAKVFPPATVTHAESLAAAVGELEAESYDIVLLDLGLPNSSGLETVDRYNEIFTETDERNPVPVVVLTGLRDDTTAVEAIERGAQDYLIKDNVDGNILHRTIRYALERHAQQQELRRQNHRLEKFANVVSHDLRNPLNVAKGRIEMVEDEHAAVIESNLSRMETIIEDVLTLAREGKSVEETEPVDLTALTKKCWQQVETASALLSTDSEIAILADPNRCRQILENLIRNSVEHVGEDVVIHVGRTDDGFYIEDNGPGIPENKRQEVFEAGYTTNRDGTGFGLSIVKETAEAHGWSVEITDGTDGGARFEFSGVAVGKEIVS